MKIIQKKYSGILNVLLLLWIIGQLFSIIQKLSCINGTPILSIFLLLDIVLIIGLVLLYRLKKRGFYLIVTVLSIRLFLSFILPYRMEMYALITIFQLGLILLLMRIKCKATGLNAYQTLSISCKDNKNAEYKDNPKTESSNVTCQEEIMEKETRRIGIGKDKKDFIDNWEIDVATESATHISGLEFRHIPEGADGREKIGIYNLPQWGRNFIDKGNTIEQCEKMQNQLYYEFVYIYEHVIKPRKHICTLIICKSHNITE